MGYLLKLKKSVLSAGKSFHIFAAQ